MSHHPFSISVLCDLNLPLETDVPLGPLTWYGVGGRAKVLAHPASVQQLGALAQRCFENNISTYVLGAGANLLVSDAGVDGVVIRLDDRAFKQVRIEKNIVTVGAGYDLAKLILETTKSGMGGLECLAGIPATVGGAVRMNAGGIYGDTGRSVLSVRVMDSNGQVYHRDRDDLVFAYRKSNIVARYITEARFELTQDDPEQLVRRVKEIYAFKSSTQPLGAHSAGCAFKNPPAEVGSSAGQLIDRAGLKGFRLGGAEISPKHANFVVAHEGCKADDILAVIRHAQSTVAQRLGVTLEREVVVWP